jgi:hypothetical protein
MMRTAELFPAYEAIALECIQAATLARFKDPAAVEVIMKMFNRQATA